MSERKVLNKYFPPDFDPDLIPRRKGTKNSQQVVRLMAPFSMRCNTCGEYIYKGKKFNARKETVQGEDYYGIKIFRFYIKCTLCSAEITFKTDPKNTDYAAEHGASRNFEPWREEKEVEEEDRLARLEEEENNPMKALENRTVDSKREMEILDALQDIRARNARNERMGQSVDLLAKIEMEEIEDEEDQERKRLEEEDEKIVQEVFAKVRAGPGPSGSGAGSSSAGGSDEPKVVTVKRKAADDVEPDLHSLLPESAKTLIKTSTAAMGAKKKTNKLAGIKVIKENLREAMSKCFEASVAGSRATKKEQEAARKALDSYVEGMITAMKANVRVNGQEMDTVNEEDLDTEPFDEALDRKIWSLNATNLDWHKQLAHQSKTQPQEIEERMRELVEERMAVDAAPAGREEDGEVEVEDVADAEAIFEQIEEVFTETSALNREVVQSLVTQQERIAREVMVEADMRQAGRM
ncbi:DUF572-domain-containing protein [Schizophyllum commune Loenen D]|nr:DUF572-domain-containing protein [Schizophyllum commune Loenen D]